MLQLHIDVHHPSKLLTALDARLVHERMCRRGAKLDDQHDRCAACQLVWRRCWAMPGCSAIGGAPQQACRLQLRIDVHHLSELLTRLPMPVPYPSRCRCSAKLDEQDE